MWAGRSGAAPVRSVGKAVPGCCYDLAHMLSKGAAFTLHVTVAVFTVFTRPQTQESPSKYTHLHTHTFTHTQGQNQDRTRENAEANSDAITRRPLGARRRRRPAEVADE